MIVTRILIGILRVVPATSSYTAPVAGPLKVTARERLKFHFTEEKINEAFDLVDCGKINLTDKNDLGDT